MVVWILTLCFFLAFAILFGIGKREEIIRNWPQYRAHPLYMITAFLYKPEKDPRSRFQFMQDNFNLVMNDLVADSLKAVLAPIMDIFQITGGGIVGGMEGVHAIQSIMKNMMDSFNSIFSIFENRYSSTLHRLAMTYHRIQTSFSRISAVATNAVYQSMATIYSMLSTLDLIMKIVIIILTILVAIVMFLFLFLWPVIPVILAVIGILTTAGMGAAVGGMAGTFCFDRSTLVQMADGTTKPIYAIQVGDDLGSNCGKVTARLEFQQSILRDLYDLHGVRVTGSHIVWHEGKAIHVSDHPDAHLLPTEKNVSLFCLNTEANRIPVITPHGTILSFADWEELSEDQTHQLKWNQYVWEQLNPGISWNTENGVISSEAAFHPATLVAKGPDEWIEIGKLKPGDIILDEMRQPTSVLGIVEIAASEVSTAGGHISSAVWRRTNVRDCWKQEPTINPLKPSAAYSGVWHSLITDKGTFRIITGESVRDFSDVGIDELKDTYSWVLESMVVGKTDK